jgi:hypothetical protein
MLRVLKSFYPHDFSYPSLNYIIGLSRILDLSSIGLASISIPHSFKIFYVNSFLLKPSIASYFWFGVFLEAPSNSFIELKS